MPSDALAIRAGRILPSRALEIHGGCFTCEHWAWNLAFRKALNEFGGCPDMVRYSWLTSGRLFDKVTGMLGEAEIQ
jgi:hypothetical protein